MCPLGQESTEIGQQIARMLAGSTESEKREKECEMRRRLDHLLGVGDVIRALQQELWQQQAAESTDRTR